jgi:membrane protease YdiL (CAAX protease family)
MGHIMLVGLSATAFLSLRRLPGSNYQLHASWADWRTGIWQFLFFIPIGLPVGWAIGFIGFHPLQADLWLYLILLPGTFLGMYAVVALLEELIFRGVLQNLATTWVGNAVVAQAITSVLFGLAHLPFRSFPNWRFAVVAAIAGWFYGQAYRERRSIVASSITHALVNTAWRLLFSP